MRDLFDPDVLPHMEVKALVLLHHALERIDNPQLRFVYREGPRPNGGSDRETWAYQLRGDTSSILLLIKVRTPDSKPRIAHVEWQPAPLDLRERFPFVLGGLPPLLHLVLGAAIVVPLLMIYALALCWKRRPPAWGLWMLCIPLGVGELSVLWLPSPFHSSYVGLSALSVQLFGVGLEKNPSYDPWTLSVSLPLGALLFLAGQRWIAGGPREGIATSETPDGSSPPKSAVR